MCVEAYCVGHSELDQNFEFTGWTGHMFVKNIALFLILALTFQFWLIQTIHLILLS